MDEWVDRLQRHLGWIIGLGGLIAWLALLYFMFWRRLVTPHASCRIAATVLQP